MALLLQELLREVIITGNTQFNQNEQVDQGTLTGLDPIISAAFYSCTTNACTGSGETQLSITSTTWGNNSLFKQVLNLFASLKLN